MTVRYLASFLLVALLPATLVAAGNSVQLKSRTFVPQPSVSLLDTTPAPPEGDGRHLLVQLAAEGAPDRTALEAAGVELLHYIPAGTWIARLDERAWNRGDARSSLRWVGRLEATDKVPARIAEGRTGEWAFDPDGRVRLRVRGHVGVSSSVLGDRLEAMGAEILQPLAVGTGWLVRADEPAILDMAELDGVLWISEDLPEPTGDNDGIRVRVHADEVQSPPYSLTGVGIVAGMMDGGPLAAHPDFAGRVTNIDGSSPLSHATHVAGTLGGNGVFSEDRGGSPFLWRGVAPDVSIITWDYYGNVLQDYKDSITLYDVDLHHNSWGFTVSSQSCDIYGDYDFLAPDLDSLVVGASGRRIPIIFSAGNERDDGDCPLLEGSYGCLNPPKAAKNLIVVGATNSDDDTMTPFSSWGPTDDGRLKPDFCAPGCEEGGEGYIKSTLPTDVYGGPGWCGTSMAAPVASGAVAVLHQAWDSTFVGTDVEPSFFRAILAATAFDLGRPGPDFAFGHGRIDIEAAAASLLGDTPFTDLVAQDDVIEHTFGVAPGTPLLKVVLAWDDPPAAPVSDPALINDLDLVLISPSETVYEPWILDPEFPSLDAVRGIDTRNNMEAVSVSAPEVGEWRARITGTNVPQGPQIASLVGIDAVGPGDVTDLTFVHATSNSVSFTWTDDRVFDYSGTLVARSLAEITWVPGRGQAYLQSQSPIPGVTVVYSRDADHTVTPWQDSGLAADTDYYYAFFSYDDARNYSSGTSIQARTEGVSGISENSAIAELELAGPRPNPASRQAEIRFGLPRDTAVQLRVFDPAGRRVANLVDTSLASGYHQVVWDGTDDRGNPVGSGLFFIELRAGGERRTQRLNWTR